ncbi:helical backbone metal receptor [Lentisphaerota bacterium ZTH]|nr:ABC transporter substrate-binding protein [Lentisphaerota bacterium]WET06937.1 helical backbone metal receptor [Lentisphaerota bacterium ZTH]
MGYLRVFALSIVFLGLVFCADAKEKPVRIVSLSPNLTELIFALGKGDCLVGRSSACDFPAAAKRITVVGKFGRPNIEQVLQVHPDFMVLSALQDKSVSDGLVRLGIKVEFFNSTGFNDYYCSLKKLGEILDCRSKADVLIRKTRAELLKFKARADAVDLAKRPKVFVVIQVAPLMTAGRGSFITKMVSYAGGINLGAVRSDSYYCCSMEWLLEQQPDVILMPGCSDGIIKKLRSRNGWKDLKAFRNNQVFNKINPDLLFRLGPRSLDGIKVLSNIFKNAECG